MAATDIPTCINCQSRLIGRPNSEKRGPDSAWHGQCRACWEVVQDQLELILDEPNGEPIQIFQCRQCGFERACRPGWTTRCHVCLDERTAPDWYIHVRDDYRDRLADPDVREDVRQFADADTYESVPKHDLVQYLNAAHLMWMTEHLNRPGWTLLATDIHGMPWVPGGLKHFSHGTWATHDACGVVQKLSAGRGRVECNTCPPDPASRTHRAREADPHFLYLVRHRRLQKFGHGDANRIRAHIRAGAEVIQVINAKHAEVITAETKLRRKYAKRITRTRRRGMLPTFGSGTEVLQGSVPVDLTTVLNGEDVTDAFGESLGPAEPHHS